MQRQDITVKLVVVVLTSDSTSMYITCLLICFSSEKEHEFITTPILQVCIKTCNTGLNYHRAKNKNKMFIHLYGT